MDDRRDRALGIAVTALNETLRNDWKTRWTIAKGMVEVVAAAAGFAWMVLVFGGVIVVSVALLVFPGPSGKDLVIGAAIAVLAIVAYFASSLQRDVLILGDAMEKIRDTLRED